MIIPSIRQFPPNLLLVTTGVLTTRGLTTRGFYNQGF